jgi:hypothetical protein
MSPAERRRALIEEMGEEIKRWLDAELPEGSLTLDQIEAVVEEVARKQSAVLVERLVEEQAPPPDNQATCPKCGTQARFKRIVDRHIFTIHGSRLLRGRRYYVCSGCRHGFAPLDAQLQVEGRAATRTVRAWQAALSSNDPFADVPGTMLLLRGLVVSESTVERTTVEVGTALRKACHTSQAAGRRGAAPAGAGAAAGKGRGNGRQGPGVGRLYLGVDGAFCPLREPWHKDGSLGKLVCRYGEAKVGVVYQTKTRDGLDEGVRWCAYTATLQKVEGFTPQFVALARAHGSDRAQELVVLGDGAEWIWKLAERHFPQALQILDYWHMTEHLYTVAHAQFGKGTDAAKEWVHDCQWYLERDITTHVLNRIAAWEPKDEEARKLRDREYGYFENNQERMRYQSFLARGYHIGSGTVESACRRLVTQRLKEAGMHWREETAEAVLAIRARLKSTAQPDLKAYC